MTLLLFEPIGHRYSVGGVEIPHVTGVIASAGLIDLSRITPADLEFYRQRGAALHKACELSDDGTLDPTTVDPSINPRLAQWRKFRLDLPFDIIESERPRMNEQYRYAGTPDRFVKLRDGRKAVIEIKTGAVQPCAAVQTAAQVVLVSFGSIWLDRYAVHLAPDGYKVKIYKTEDMQRDFGIFVAALNLYHWRREHVGADMSMEAEA